MTRTFTYYIATDKYGSECEGEFTVEDEEIEGMTPEQVDRYIEEQARECCFQYIEWSYVEESRK